MKIISGGQTGADRAALDWAIAQKWPHNGWCPKGRRAEDGVIDARYQLQETPSADPTQRTAWNIRDSDGTVIFSIRETLFGGSLLTAQLAADYQKPLLHLYEPAFASEIAMADANRAVSALANALRAFIQTNRIESLNIAGPRVSEEPAIGRLLSLVLEKAFSQTPES